VAGTGSARCSDVNVTILNGLRAADSPPGRGSAPVGPLSYCCVLRAPNNQSYCVYHTATTAFHQSVRIAQFHPLDPRAPAAPGFRRHANAPPNRHRIPLATTTRNAPHASDQNLLGLRPRGKEKDEPSFAFPPACGAGAESSCRQSRSPRPRDVSISSSSSLRTHSGPLRSHLVLSDLLSSSQKSFASALSCSLMRSRSAFRW
jgi:hypothetical protein